MPKRSDLKKILILGAGPIIIGQACEFDYSGVQACQVLKEEGIKIVLINSNPATIMTDPNLADQTYIEPLKSSIIEKIIQKEKPNAILPTMGGQTALNCLLKLHKKKILTKNNIEIIGVTISAIQKAEDRHLFEKSMKKINLKTAPCKIVNNLQTALLTVEEIGFPCIIRPSFTMGGSGGGIAYSLPEFKKICRLGFKLSPTHELLIDKSLIGWKEYELEIIRDTKENFIVVCSIENLDPMGIHTGDSITVAPSQTLSDIEFQKMRNASKNILQEIGVHNGGANVQFAINPKNGDMIIIEMNPRVSRSSALASKATGFPIARISTKLAIGYTLDELQNEITGVGTPAAFEPSLDYVVVKMPRFNFEKFPECTDRLTTQMKSVGEVMAIGRTFSEALQKSIQSLEINSSGFDITLWKPASIEIINNEKKLIYELTHAGPERVWYIGEAFRKNWSIKKINHFTKIDPWFLYYIQEIIFIEKDIKKIEIQKINLKFLKFIKKKGFSDLRISQLINVKEKIIRDIRLNSDIRPVYKRIDTCAAEFSTETAYLYSTWDDECESIPTKNKKKIIILGGGPNRIGQGIEFDYCCVHASQALMNKNYETIMINCNPETVSTDYNMSNRLYFEPITLEHIISIVNLEKPLGIIIQYGGQTPLKLAKYFQKLNIKILGTTYENIDKAENRNKFQKIIQKLKFKQPNNYIVNTFEEASQKSKILGYPIIMRPSYVLGGRDMKIIKNPIELNKYFKNLKNTSQIQKILLDQYLENATEIDVDIVCDGINVLIGGILEHIEPAGIHSGDSACVFPPYTLSSKIIQKIKKQVKKLAIELSIKGLMNAQFAIQKKKIYILEVNPRASRTIPFLSKATGYELSKISAYVMINHTLKKQKCLKEKSSKYFFVKEVVLPFNKFENSNLILGPEMKSTGEVMGIGKKFSHAFYKALQSTVSKILIPGLILCIIPFQNLKKIFKICKKFINLGFIIDFVSKKIYKFLENSKLNLHHINCLNLKKIYLKEILKNKKYVYIINIPDFSQKKNYNKEIFQYIIQNQIHYDTTLKGVYATYGAFKNHDKINVYSIQQIQCR
ncbi:Carbamoyl-phosphate synthase large chain [Buchnera aphidicola (Tuberolachnus salignus)]|uniref:Carbamoyl phosphate synthase large chain n=1 Tax=Buchnera aphidicola subsp. Tuberolachnus salignus TaxID=98804 RepID=A0A160SWN6_BUCTT|nr:carbamoyl-phosphate synthase large subunit [Buchnera aphidicola]CUR53080.1 Carbamoyl-phosphate synthase large chain [Buchnera aphidicola (Tuberolachnus salignus)]